MTKQKQRRLVRDGDDEAGGPRAIQARAVDDEETPLADILAFLAARPSIEALLAANPGLTLQAVQEIFARASAPAERTRTVRRRKSAQQVDIAATHALPEADGMLHKGSIFRALLSPLKPGRLLDLGAGKGNFSLTAAQLGWQVTAVDARTVRWPDAEAEEDAATKALIATIRWVQADVREFPIAPGEYDLICILGLLHHLEVADQAALIRRCAGTLLLIDTRIAPAIIDREGPYEGMVVREHGETRDERDLVPTAAWGNAHSFRHTEESLIHLLRENGYAQVMPMRPPHRRDYTFYLCLPPPEASGAGRKRRGDRGLRQR